MSRTFLKSSIVDGIDVNRNSRQMPVFGFDGLKRMMKSDVFIVGVGGIGAEIGTLKHH